MCAGMPHRHGRGCNEAEEGTLHSSRPAPFLSLLPMLSLKRMHTRVHMHTHQLLRGTWAGRCSAALVPRSTAARILPPPVQRPQLGPGPNRGLRPPAGQWMAPGQRAVCTPGQHQLLGWSRCGWGGVCAAGVCVGEAACEQPRGS